MIPKIVHVCWFGSNNIDESLSQFSLSKRVIEKYGYHVNLWTEKNYDVSKSPAVHLAYQRKKWSLVSNYARVDILNQYGGIYIDSDVEVVKNFDDLIKYDFFYWIYVGLRFRHSCDRSIS